MGFWEDEAHKPVTARPCERAECVAQFSRNRAKCIFYERRVNTFLDEAYVGSFARVPMGPRYWNGNAT